MGNFRLPGMWLEYLLIAILIVLVIATAYQLFGDYLGQELTRLCLDNNIPCPGVPTATPTPQLTPTPTTTGFILPPLAWIAGSG
jgi:hypothetical protein